jgi:hypothetical protein
VPPRSVPGGVWPALSLQLAVTPIAMWASCSFSSKLLLMFEQLYKMTSVLSILYDLHRLTEEKSDERETISLQKYNLAETACSVIRWKDLYVNLRRSRYVSR